MRPVIDVQPRHVHPVRRKFSALAVVIGLVSLVTTLAVAPARASAFEYSDISTGYHRTCAVTTDGLGLCWGWNHSASLGTGTPAETIFVPSLVALPNGEKFSSIHAGSYFTTCGLTRSGKVFCWGEGGSVAHIALPADTTATQLSVGATQGCVVTADSQLYCWGDWLSGELGVGDIEPTQLPVRVTLPDDAVPAFVSAGVGFTCATTTSGSAYCWGANGDGQLGNGHTTSTKVPVKVTLSPGVSLTSISAGLERTCALDSQGGGWCWGRNYSGALGDDTYVNSSVPRRVALPVGITLTSLSTGWYHTCGITNGGSVLCWGENSSGALGTGSTLGGKTIRTSLLPAGTSATSLRTGLAGTCIVTTTRQALCWGGNLRGSVGTGTSQAALSPTRILGVGTPDASSPSVPSLSARGASLSGSILLNGATGTAVVVVADNPTFSNATTVRVSLPRPSGIADVFTPVSFATTLTGLRPATEYFAKIVVTTPYGRGESDATRFTTLGARPSVADVSIRTIEGDNVGIGASVTANLLDTTAIVTVADDSSMSRNLRTFALGSIPEVSTAPVDLTTTITGLTPRTSYWATVTASNEVGTSTSPVVSFTTVGDQPTLSDLRTAGAKRSGSASVAVHPGGLDTVVLLSYRTHDSRGPWTIMRRFTRGSSQSVVQFDMSGLQPAATYDVHVVATNALGSSVLPDATFTTTGGAPIVDPPTAENLGDTSVILIAAIDPNEFSTRVTLQIDTSDSFSNPDEWFAGDVKVGDATTIALEISNLVDSTTYYARFVARNARGATVGEAVTFTTSTPVGKLLKRRTNPTDPAPIVEPIPVIELPIGLESASPFTSVAAPTRVTASAVKSQRSKQTNQARPGSRKSRLRQPTLRRR